MSDGYEELYVIHEELYINIEGLLFNESRVYVQMKFLEADV